jgi:hypothetical protein
MNPTIPLCSQEPRLQERQSDWLVGFRLDRRRMLCRLVGVGAELVTLKSMAYPFTSVRFGDT